MEQENKPFAFISYSRKDKKVANWLHKRIEDYEYPKNLVNVDQHPPHDKHIRPIFLDTKDMQIEVRPFTERIKHALEDAQFLILICSYNSAKSPFVDKEIRFFWKAMTTTTHISSRYLLTKLMIIRFLRPSRTRQL